MNNELTEKDWKVVLLAVKDTSRYVFSEFEKYKNKEISFLELQDMVRELYADLYEELRELEDYRLEKGETINA